MNRVEHARDLDHLPVRYMTEDAPVPMNDTALPVVVVKYLTGGWISPFEQEYDSVQT